MATSIKITDTFTVTAKDGTVFGVQEHTRIESGRVGKEKREIVGRSFLKTDDGRGVLKKDDGTFTIPSLGVTAIRVPATPQLEREAAPS